MFKRLLLGVGALVALSACTPEEVVVWQNWHSEDPAAAEEFANTHVLAERGARYQATTTDPPPPEPEVAWGVWDRLAQCESGGNWSINTGNGYYGGLQFSLTSWRAVGGSGYPHQHSRSEQIHRGERLKAIQGWGAWPSCSRQLGLR